MYFIYEITTFSLNLSIIQYILIYLCNTFKELILDIKNKQKLIYKNFGLFTINNLITLHKMKLFDNNVTEKEESYFYFISFVEQRKLQLLIYPNK